MTLSQKFKKWGEVIFSVQICVLGLGSSRAFWDIDVGWRPRVSHSEFGLVPVRVLLSVL